MMELCFAVRENCGGVCSLPTRRSSVPCHVKLDTEAVVQSFVACSERVEMRQLAGRCSMTQYGSR